MHCTGTVVKRSLQQAAGSLSALNEPALHVLVIGDPENAILSELGMLKDNVRIVGVYNNISEVISSPDKLEQLLHADTIFNVSGNAKNISEFIPLMPSLSWFHSITAGLDHIWCDSLLNDDNIRVSNTKGVFCLTLAEYVMGACLHFAKQVPLLMQQQNDKNWNRFFMHELRGSTMGIVGYGDIGRATAKLAKAFGMSVSAYRRRPELYRGDDLVDNIFLQGELQKMMATSDYVVVCAPLTADTIDLISTAELAIAKPGQVIINVGRGPIINEAALISALKSGDRIKGCALDVFNQEPLPETSELWSLPNLLLSPHNADFTTHSRRRSVRNFVTLCEKIILSEPIIYADKALRY